MGVKLRQVKRNPEARNCQAAFLGMDAVCSLRGEKARQQRKPVLKMNGFHAEAVPRIAMAAAGYLLACFSARGPRIQSLKCLPFNALTAHKIQTMIQASQRSRVTATK